MYKTMVRVNFFDADPAGIMFFGNIFKFAHAAFEQMIASAGFSRNYFNDPDYATPLMHVEADYSRPILPGTDVRVELGVSVLKESSFEISYTFFNGEELAARVKTVHIFIDRRRWAKTRMTSELSDFLKGHLTD